MSKDVSDRAYIVVPVRKDRQRPALAKGLHEGPWSPDGGPVTVYLDLDSARARLAKLSKMHPVGTYEIRAVYVTVCEVVSGED